MNYLKKYLLLYWGNIMFFSTLYQIDRITGNMNFFTSSLEISMLFFTACVIGFRIFGYKISPIRIVIVLLVSLCFSPAMHFTSIMSIALIFMNGLNEYPQPITDGITILYALAFTVIALRICTVGHKLRLPSGTLLLICFIPFLTFIVIGVVLTLICGDAFILTSSSTLIIYIYNTCFSFVFVDITIGLSIYEMLKYNKEKQQDEVRMG